jgi:RimJ/RimL family protein N-acetyltransferase
MPKSTGQSELRSARLLLRRWRPEDRLPFARMNADPKVMEFFPALLSSQESDAVADRIETHFAQRDFGFWAVELIDVAPFIGFIGLAVPRFEYHFTPCVEIGWRLAADYWGQGLASEGATLAMNHGFTVLQLKEIVAYTVPTNLRSLRVMEKLGMTYYPQDDFDHPLVPVGHPLKRHVLYRKSS